MSEITFTEEDYLNGKIPTRMKAIVAVTWNGTPVLVSSNPIYHIDYGFFDDDHVENIDDIPLESGVYKCDLLITAKESNYAPWDGPPDWDWVITATNVEKVISTAN